MDWRVCHSGTQQSVAPVRWLSRYRNYTGQFRWFSVGPKAGYCSTRARAVAAKRGYTRADVGVSKTLNTSAPLAETTKAVTLTFPVRPLNGSTQVRSCDERRMPLVGRGDALRLRA
ncbi:Uncharacterised protein [Mycobacteroides abscessus subsp. massiliense]|nr:Uncharacterised protein [Mycobacteroides abscessus subsp. massiliense]